MNIFRFVSILIVALSPALLLAEEYTIKKGDTLWDISEEKMKDPFLWKKIWEANPHIKNPHLIFPDRKLNIPDDLTKKEDIKEDKAIASKKSEAIQPVKITPKKIPIRQWGYLVSKEALLQSGFITDAVTVPGKISGSPKKQDLMGRGDYVYIETDKPSNIGDKFYILTAGKKISHPVTEKLVGYLVKIKGVLEIQGEDNGNKKALIVESYEEITPEDKIAPFYPVEPPLRPEKERRPAVNGTIIKLWNDYNISGGGDIVYLDKGAKDGIEVGDVFTVISGEKPHVNIGTAQVISLKDKTSVALLKKAVGEIKTGDSFRN
ncbi:MAG TPA: hypothetical protein DHV16_06370 [Nitrospiraceae bacterium]|nr:MAG: hypothetical protein A2Z82_06400 [Nitrospirae bacterium GWA2_46_11]OGW24854.1 MAG: hypothetical protein A2X55_08165 [Nitrospirae bacterium GWB2_47_37]HAK88182.1 hypothetical protein [Nitrospiraceae bacterium]HCZ11868.1 hypothetical protein [Nitrospiraceae bacterium]